MIKVVNSHNHKRTNSDYYIGRGSHLGNPYTHMNLEGTKAKFNVETRDKAIKSYKEYICDEILAGNKAVISSLAEISEIILTKGDVHLVCFCKPKSCHGDVIKSIIEKVHSDDEHDDTWIDSHFNLLLKSVAIEMKGK